MKLKKKVKRFLIFILILIILGVGGYLYYLYGGNTVKKAVVVNSIPGYGYKLKSNKNAAYKKEFSNLKDILTADKVDEKKYAKSISKLFIIDFYSLKDKKARTDVGGVDFIHKDEKTDFLEKAEDTIYKYVETNLNGKRNQKLPRVSKVKIESIDTDSFKYGENTDDEAYVVKANWEYEDESEANGYQDSATITIVHEGKKLALVELK